VITFATFDAEAWQVALAAALCLGLLAWSLAALERHRAARLHRFAAPETLARLRSGYAPGLRRPLNAFVLLGALFLVLALAGPQVGTGGTAPGRGSRDILVLLDTSPSMNAANPAPSRLERARRKVGELLSRHPGDRFGLVAFAGAAALQCPLTTDHAYFKTILHTLDTDTISQAGTDIQSALEEAAGVFRKESARENDAGRAGRIVILISDGEAVSGEAVAAAADLGAASHVMVLGIGDPEGAEVTLPQWMGRAGQSPGGTVTHWSRLDEEHLAAIARAGGGVYARSTLGDDDLDVIDRELGYLAGRAGEHDPGRRAANRYRWPLAAALALFALEGLWLAAMPWFARRGAAAGKEGAHELA